MKKSLDELFRVAEGIAMFLGRGWGARKRELPDHPGCGDVSLVNGPYAVEIGTSDYAKYRGKYLFIPRWPQTSGGSVLGSHVTYSPETDIVDSIAASQSKTEQELALEFERRLEDRYIKAFDIAQRRMLKEEADRAEQLRVADSLATLLDSRAVAHGNQPTEQPVIDHYGVRQFCVGYDGKTITRMELRCIPVEVARKIIDLLRLEVPR